jgi:hypothetical protein
MPAPAGGRRFAGNPAASASAMAAPVPASSSVPDAGASRTRGSYYDLVEVFERINSTCFGGRVERPHLTWNAVLTRRKLGHYQPGTDTVMISLTLDSPSVPAFVVDFIMYHELLHKTFGVPLVNGRQRAHTAAFRRAEKQFPRYDEAQEFIKKIAGMRRRSGKAAYSPRRGADPRR